MNVEIIEQNGYNFLWIDGELWMYDIPSERQVQQEIADQAYGNVLVAGYGLGVLQKMLIDNPRTDIISVTTIEKNMGVMKACGKEFDKLYGQVVCEDFYKFIPSIAKVNHIDEYDCVIGDIWLEIHPLFLEQYKRFKKKAETLIKPSGKILAWGKEYFEYLIEQE